MSVTAHVTRMVLRRRREAAGAASSNGYVKPTKSLAGQHVLAVAVCNTGRDCSCQDSNSLDMLLSTVHTHGMQSAAIISHGIHAQPNLQLYDYTTSQCCLSHSIPNYSLLLLVNVVPTQPLPPPTPTPFSHAWGDSALARRAEVKPQALLWRGLEAGCSCPHWVGPPAQCLPGSSSPE